MRTSPLTLTALAGSALLLSLSPAFAQGGRGGGSGGGGGGGGGAPQRSAPAMSQPDRDRMKDQDRDRLYLGAKDRIRLHDQDGDNKLNQNEFNEWRGAMFGAIAPDGNGFTLQQYLAVRLGPGPKASSNPARQQQMQERADLRKTERFRVMDGNGDGVVTRAEWMDFGDRFYGEADRNNDGKVSAKELNRYNRGM